MEALQLIKNIPDNTIGVVLINAVDHCIIKDPNSSYIKNLHRELKRILIPNGVVFGFQNSILKWFNKDWKLYGDYEDSLTMNLWYINLKS